jgi:hypothetical protein
MVSASQVRILSATCYSFAAARELLHFPILEVWEEFVVILGSFVLFVSAHLYFQETQYNEIKRYSLTLLDAYDWVLRETWATLIQIQLYEAKYNLRKFGMSEASK